MVLDTEDLQKFQLLADENPLQMMEYWSVDPDYDGNVHRPQAFSFRKKGTMELGIAFPGLSGGIHPISVVAVDVLGNRYQTILKAE